MNFYKKRKRTWVAPKVVCAFLPVVAKTEGERAYGGAVGELLDAQNTIGPTTTREMMGALNGLMETLRRLDAQLEVVSRAMNAQTLTSASAERDRLHERLAGAKDEVALQTLKESLAVCEARLARVESLSPMRERVEAQQEAILQIFASARSSLAGLSVSTPLAVWDAAPHIETVREAAAQLQKRTLAVEQAVQEVIALRGSS